MKITEFGPIKSTSSIKKRGNVSATGSFSDLLESAGAGEISSTGGVTDVAATAALNNLLALQEISEEDIQRKKLMLQGSNLLDSLEKLRMQLLAGQIPLNTLQDLSRQLSIKKQFVADPRLNDIIEDIELRAAVELAKLEAARNS